MNNIKAIMPAIQRARGNRLYLADGGRLLDLCLDDGYRFLSYQDSKTRTYACNAVSKGLTSAYPGLHEKRFAKALSSFVGRKLPSLVFPSEAAALHCLFQSFNEHYSVSELWPPCGDTNDSEIFRLRPFLAVPEQGTLLFPVPCFRAFAPVVLLFNEERLFAQALDVYTSNMAGLYSVPAINYYVGTRALHSLPRLKENGYDEAHWENFLKDSAGLFSGNGPYVYPLGDDYPAFFEKALASGILLNPRNNAPSIIPMEYSKGELKKLIASFRKN